MLLKSKSTLLVLLLGLVSVGVQAAGGKKLRSPASGVVCDAYFCADAEGISNGLTTEYLGAKKSEQLAAQGEFDRTAFTFANGVYCDTKEKVCRKDRSFGADGKPAGAVDATTTKQLFGGRSTSAHATGVKKLRSPASGVLCDAYFCADAEGISNGLTTEYLGAKKSEQLAAQGEFDRTAFTFANGVYCDTKEKVCRKDRSFGADGKPAGAVDLMTTKQLFGH
ncbi:YcgJ family protein (plasmid) [Serratia nevei]|uniref:YcgJ family protein n=1 Tax=Serratia nevei TaxID=2703794 RepID=UPI003F6D157B